MLTTPYQDPRTFDRFRRAVVTTVFAIATCCIGVAPSAGQDTAPAGPDRLSRLAIEVARPLTDPQGQYDDAARAVSDLPVSAALGMVLDFHRGGQLDEAREAWAGLTMPASAEVWRQLALAMCDLAQDKMHAAEARLESARQLSPDHPVMHYLYGMYYLVSDPTTALSRNTEDAVLIQRVSLPPPVERVTPGGDRLRAAEHHFQCAIELSAGLCDAAPLVTRHDTTEVGGLDLPRNGRGDPSSSLSPPTVRDYLQAIGCADYVARSHLGLAYVYLETGPLARAEKNLAAATTFGLPVQDEWLHLGAAYEQRGLHADAARAYLEAVAHGPAIVQPIRLAWQNCLASFK